MERSTIFKYFQWEHPLFLWSFFNSFLYVYPRVIRKGLTEDEASEGDVLMFFWAQAANDYQGQILPFGKLT